MRSAKRAGLRRRSHGAERRAAQAAGVSATSTTMPRSSTGHDRAGDRALVETPVAHAAVDGLADPVPHRLPGRDETQSIASPGPGRARRARDVRLRRPGRSCRGLPTRLPARRNGAAARRLPRIRRGRAPQPRPVTLFYASSRSALLRLSKSLFENWDGPGFPCRCEYGSHPGCGHASSEAGWPISPEKPSATRLI